MDQLEKTAAIRFVEFVEQYQVKNKKIYLSQLLNFKNSDKTTLMVNMRHLIHFDSTFSTAIYKYYYRFLPYLCKAVEYLVYKHCPILLYTDGEVPQLRESGLDTQMPMYNDNHRPLRHFNVAFDQVMHPIPLRQLHCEKIGELVEIVGTITRTSDVRPELRVATFTCRECGTEIKNVHQDFKYTEPKVCPDTTCGNTIQFDLQLHNSKFVNWQKCRFQESADELPSGSMPRTIDIICRGDVVEMAKAGDKCCISGTLLAIPDVSAYTLKLGGVQIRRGGQSRPTNGVSGLKDLGARELNHKLVFMASHLKPVSGHKQIQIVPAASSTATSVLDSTINDPLNIPQWIDPDQCDPNELLKTFTPLQKNKILEMTRDPNLYNNCVDSIAPSIFNCDEIKKGLLLQLISGVHKQNLRGDINILLVGDPGTAKSQFLKWICDFHPRSIFTSGRASSAAGLTASVIRDEETNEYTIEAGALMLADQGICAIDEFEKMDLKDQVAIHEAMEQQTISLSKAGIQATLNARTSILAACNPTFGRYNVNKSILQNVHLGGPLLSRFDLIFIMTDNKTEAEDLELSTRIVQQHRMNTTTANSSIYSMEELRDYIKFCKTIQPVLTVEAADYLSKMYKKQRLLNKMDKMTVRSMESMIRLSEALARLHGQNEVHVAFAKEAYRLWLRDETVVTELELESVQFKTTMKISGTMYNKCKQLVIYHLKQQVEEFIHLSELIVMLMEEMEQDIDDIVEMEKLLKGIIMYMVNKEHILVMDTSDEDVLMGLNPMIDL